MYRPVFCLLVGATLIACDDDVKASSDAGATTMDPATVGDSDGGEGDGGDEGSAGSQGPNGNDGAEGSEGREADGGQAEPVQDAGTPGDGSGDAGTGMQPQPDGYPTLPQGGWDNLDTGLPAFPAPETGSGFQMDLYNFEAVVPPQCYTRTEGKFNPCYVCHQDPIDGVGRENRMADGDLQGEYSFSDEALTNGWRNLFIDRSGRVAQISDDEILEYIGQDNYTALRPRLIDSQWSGWIPDLWALQEGALAFDEDGFARDGSWWVAFKYKPMPSTFWPTNGATDDVMIRLAPKFWKDAEGNDSREVYRANLAILEAAVKGYDEIGIKEIDEAVVAFDLDGDGELGKATRVRRPLTYIGAAADVEVHTYLYPRYTEFLHTVRYVALDESGNVTVSRRMKEVRYMQKHTFYRKSTLGGFYDQEFMEKLEGMLPMYPDLKEQGLDNKFGWLIRGYIEDAEGELRPATYEEGFFCMGCHTTIGSTIDKVFSFARKVDGEAGWGYIDLRGMPDAPNMGEAEGEILTYLKRVGGGAEFRNNPEMAERWYDAQGNVKEDEVRAADTYELITPSAKRAMTLNKAYKVIVEGQDFIRGRDATVEFPVNVFDQVENGLAPLEPEFRFDWDIRLDWAAGGD